MAQFNPGDVCVFEGNVWRIASRTEEWSGTTNYRLRPLSKPGTRFIDVAGERVEPFPPEGNVALNELENAIEARTAAEKEVERCRAALGHAVSGD